MRQLDPIYLKAALETLDLIQSLVQHYNQIQTINKFPDTLSQIEAKAQSEIDAIPQTSTELHQLLEIDIPSSDSGSKTSAYWQGVRDMTRIVVKRWSLGEKEIPSFQEVLFKLKKDLSEKLPDEDSNPLEKFLKELREDKDPSQATPYIYYPPYPKPPPEGMAEAIERPKITSIIGESQNDSPPEKEISKDNAQPLATRILEKTEENDEMLSQSLRDALRILRDED